MTAHAKFSASGAHRWMRCPASLALEATVPNRSSGFANEGTAAHELAEMCLTSGNDADAFVGRVILVEGDSFVVDEDMAAYVQAFVDPVRELADGGVLLVEQRVDFAAAIGVEAGQGFGTADAIVITRDGELQVHDLKYGRGVKVDAQDNEQLQLYAIGAVRMLDMAYDFDRARLFIHQPRLGHLSEWAVSLPELQDFAVLAKDVTENIQVGTPDYVPAEKQCRFCNAKDFCPALERKIADEVVGNFADLTDPPALAEAIDDLPRVFSAALGRKMAVVDTLEQWCKAVRARVESELQAGRAADGYKLVEGRRGPRKWNNPSEVETLLKGMRLKTEEIYDLKLISPTTAEKLAKGGTIGPRQWPRVELFITQSPGAPSVAPESDPRAALNPTDDFSDLTLA
jgi:CRISPR/Cas system-associated exonuclease Cas4 (RecB family)